MSDIYVMRQDSGEHIRSALLRLEASLGDVQKVVPSEARQSMLSIGETL